jgi:hypothetical protein
MTKKQELIDYVIGNEFITKPSLQDTFTQLLDEALTEQLHIGGVSQQRELLIADMIKMIKSYTDEEVNLVCKQRNEMYGSNL